MAARALLAALAAVAALALAGGGSSAPTPACTGGQLAGNFTAVPGSAGAGNIVYALHVRYLSGPTCFVSGLPQIHLLDRNRRALPTKVTPAFRQGLTAVMVRMSAGHGAKATARFSPDIPGPGEPQTKGPCERTSYYVRVTLGPGGASFLGPVKPATPVCEHGGMSVSALGPA